MGFFAQLLGSPIENQLREFYVQNLQAGGMPASQAREAVNTFLQEAKKEGAAEGTLNLPQDFGDRLLAREARDGHTKDFLGKKRSQGVRDEDIRWWWKLHDLERRIMLKMDNLSRMTTFLACRDQGMTPEQAAARIRKLFPSYGDLDADPNTTGDDRPLPHELKDRVNRYVESRAADPSTFKKEIEESTSLNALVRREIANGRI